VLCRKLFLSHHILIPIVDLKNIGRGALGPLGGNKVEIAKNGPKINQKWAL
jgi:hypothetical protein